MKNDFDMILHKFDTDVTIIPVSDVHLGAIEHNAKAWRDFCAWVADEPNTYLLLGGDLINNSVRNSVANPFDEVLRPREQKQRIVEYLAPLREKILACVSGNHEARTTKDSDQDITYDIMSKLDLEDIYRPNTAFLKISLGERGKGKPQPNVSYTFALTHGTGGGIYTGAAVNRNERYGNIIEGCDCLIVGHTHKGTITRPSKIKIDQQNNVVSVQSYLVVGCESWLNYGGYAMRKMLLPSEVAKPQRLKLYNNKHDKRIEVLW